MLILTVEGGCPTRALVTVEASRPGFQINKGPMLFWSCVWLLRLAPTESTVKEPSEAAARVEREIRPRATAATGALSVRSTWSCLICCSWSLSSATFLLMSSRLVWMGEVPAGRAWLGGSEDSTAPRLFPAETWAAPRRKKNHKPIIKQTKKPAEALERRGHLSRRPVSTQKTRNKLRRLLWKPRATEC